MTKEEYILKEDYTFYEDQRIWSKAKEKFLEGYVNKKGYVQVTLKCIDGKYRTFYWHRVIWFAFNGPIPEGMQVNHIREFEKTNNALSNLNLMTPKENCNWGTRNERFAAKMKGRKFSEEHKAKLRGIPKSDEWKEKMKNHPNKSKAVVAVDEDNNVVYEFASTNDAGRNGFDQAAVSACCRHMLGYKTHKGLRWYFKEDWEQMQKASPHKREDA